MINHHWSEETSVISDLSPTEPTMAQQQTQLTTGSGILDAVPLFVVILLAAHVLALVFWMYKLASEKQPPRRKTQ